MKSRMQSYVHVLFSVVELFAVFNLIYAYKKKKILTRYSIIDYKKDPKSFKIIVVVWILVLLFALFCHIFFSVRITAPPTLPSI